MKHAIAIAIAAAAGLAGPACDHNPPSDQAIAAMAARPATDLGHHVCINTRTAYGGTPHADYMRVRAALDYMGIRCIRDGLWRPDNGDGIRQRPFFRELGRAGFGATMMVGELDEDRNSQCDPVPKFRRFGLVQEIKDDPDLAALVDRIESVNEPDLFEPFPGWHDCLRSYQQQLHDEVAGFRPVVGPSFVSAMREFPNLQGVDVGNIHPYTGGQPGPNFDDQRAFTCDHVAPGKPCRSTEVGYHTDTQRDQGVPPATQAVYNVRLVLESLIKGLDGIDLYTIVDQGIWPGGVHRCSNGEGSYPGHGGDGIHDSGDWGFYDCRWNPKPVAHAFHNLSVLTSWTGPRVEGGSLRVGWSNMPPEARHVLVRTSVGYVALLWRRVPMGTAPVTVTLRTDQRPTRVRRFNPVQSTTALQTWTRPSSLNVQLGPTPVVLQVTP